jgi:hypothetical protein
VDRPLQSGEEPALSSTFALGNHSVTTEMEGTVVSIPSNGSPCMDDLVGDRFASTSTAFEVPTRHEPPVELDGTVRTIEELSDLNLRIYKATTTSPMRVSCDDMIEMAGSLLRILTIAVDAAKKSCAMDQPARTPDSLSYRRDSHPRRHSSESSIYASDTHMALMPDTGTVLMIFSCYQRLLDFLKQICLKLHLSLSNYRPERTARPGSVCNDECERDFSTAQVVMTSELISHLLGRLHRGLHQLMMAFSFDAQPPLSPEVTSISFPLSPQSSSEPAVLPSGCPTCSGSFDDGRGARSMAGMKFNSCFQGAKSVIETMAQTQSALYAHIELIRRSIEESDGI